MERRSMTEGQTARMGEDGEYDIADYMESDNCPESSAIIAEFAGMGIEFLADEFGAEEVEDEGEPEDEEPAADKPWGFLFK